MISNARLTKCSNMTCAKSGQPLGELANILSNKNACCRSRCGCVKYKNCLYLFGGSSQPDRFTGVKLRSDLCCVDVSNNRWYKVVCWGKTFPPPRMHHITAIRDGMLLVHGGIGSTGATLNDMWVLPLKSSSHEWRKLLIDTKHGVQPEGLSSHACAAYKTRLLIHGGKTATTTSAALYSFTFDTQRWEAVKATNIGPLLYGHTVDVLDDVLYVYGGYTYHKGDHETGNCQLFSYDLYSGIWRTINYEVRDTRSGLSTFPKQPLLLRCVKQTRHLWCVAQHGVYYAALPASHQADVVVFHLHSVQTMPSQRLHPVTAVIGRTLWLMFGEAQGTHSNGMSPLCISQLLSEDHHTARQYYADVSVFTIDTALWTSHCPPQPAKQPPLEVHPTDPPIKPRSIRTAPKERTQVALLLRLLREKQDFDKVKDTLNVQHTSAAHLREYNDLLSSTIDKFVTRTSKPKHGKKRKDLRKMKAQAAELNTVMATMDQKPALSHTRALQRQLQHQTPAETWENSVTVQAFARFKVASAVVSAIRTKVYDDKWSAANRIQALQRGRKAREVAKTKKTELKKSEAATKIQALRRGRAARLELYGTRRRSEVKHSKKSARESIKEAHDERDGASRKIQHAFRNRASLAKQKAAIRIQAMLRGYLVRKQMEYQSKSVCLRVLINCSIYRHSLKGLLTMLQAYTTTPSCVMWLDRVLQAGTPALAALVSFEKQMFFAVIKIQRRFRLYLSRKQLKKLLDLKTLGFKTSECRTCSPKLQDPAHRGEEENTQDRQQPEHSSVGPPQGPQALGVARESQTEAATRIQTTFRKSEATKASHTLQKNRASQRKAEVAAAEEQEKQFMDKAAMKIQSTERGRKARKQARRDSKKKSERQEGEAATRIQAAFRKSNAEQASQILHKNRMLQRDAEIAEAEEQENRFMNEAATKIQSIERRRQAQKEVQRKQELHLLEENPNAQKAATLIQTTFRRTSAVQVSQSLQKNRTSQKETGLAAAEEQEKQFMNKAAVKIQSAERGKQARNKARRELSKRRYEEQEGEHLRKPSEVQESEHAATQIQAVFRKSSAARESQMLHNEDMLQRAAEIAAAEEQEKQFMNEAATKIQSIERRRQAQQEVQRKRVNMHKAATKMQSAERGRRARGEAQQRRKSKHVSFNISSQAVGLEGHSAQDSEQEAREQKAAVCIQVAFRQSKVRPESRARAEVKKVHGEKEEMSKILEQEQQFINQAATTVQSAERGRQARKEARRKREVQKEKEFAATKIQSAERRRQAKRKVKSERAHKRDQRHQVLSDKESAGMERQFMNRAAIRIQSAARARYAQNQLKKRCVLAAKMNSPKVSFDTQSPVAIPDDSEMQEAALRIQSTFKGFKSRADTGVRAETTSALHAAELELAIKQEEDFTNRAAVRIQSAERGRRVRSTQKSKKSQTEAATRIQTTFRKSEATKASHTLQKNRASQRKAEVAAAEEQEKQFMDKAAMKIQSTERGRKARKQAHQKRGPE